MLEVPWIDGPRLLVVKLLTLETAVNKNLLYSVVGRDSKKEDQLWMNEDGCNIKPCSPKAISSHRITTTPSEPSMFQLQPPS